MNYSRAKQIFGIEGFCTEQKLKEIYRDLAKENHPDFGGSNEKMQEVNAAYDLLKNRFGRMEINEYKKSVVDRITKDYLEEIDLIKHKMDFSSESKSYYQRNGIFTFCPSLVSNIVKKYNDLIKDIEKSSSKEEIDKITQEFCNEVREEYNKFIKELFEKVKDNYVRDDKPFYEYLVNEAEDKLKEITSVTQLFKSFYLCCKEIENKSKKIKEFIPVKKNKLEEYKNLVENNIPHQTEEYSKASKWFETLFKIREPKDFNEIYDEAFGFVSGYVKEKKKRKLALKVQEVRTLLLERFNEVFKKSSIEEVSKINDLFGYAIDTLKMIAVADIDDADFSLFENITFENINKDVNTLNKIRKNPDGGIFIKKGYFGNSPKIYYVKNEEGKVFVREIYLDGRKANTDFTEENINVFMNNYLSLDMFFDRAREINANVEVRNTLITGGKSYLEYDGIMLCSELDRASNKRNFVFVETKDVKIAETNLIPTKDRKRLHEEITDSINLSMEERKIDVNADLADIEEVMKVFRR